MIKLFSFLQSRELVGVVCGLGWAAMSPNWERWLWKPTSALMELTMVAMLAAFIVAAAMASAGHRVEAAVRRGTGAGGVALLVTGAVFLWVMRGTAGFYPLRAWSILATSAMPALLAGSIAAGVGALCFRRRVEQPPDLVELPRGFRWSVRSLLALGFLSALVAPWIPRSIPKKVEIILPASVASATSSPSVVASRPREVFVYTTPEALKGAPAAAWKIKTTRRLGQMTAERGLAFSKDQRFLVGLESDRTIVVHDLESEGVRRISGIPFPVLHVSFSPDAERLFVVMQSQPLRVGVGFLKNGSFVLLPQPKKYAVPEGWASWSKEDEVVFLPKSGPTVVLSLHTLEIDPIALSPSELERLKREQVFDFPSNERWAFGRRTCSFPYSTLFLSFCNFGAGNSPGLFPCHACL